jgi:hypothetical protein
MADYNQSLGFPTGLRIHNLDVGEYADLMSSNEGLGAPINAHVGGGATYLDTLQYLAEMNAYVDSDFTGQVIWADSQQPSIENELAEKQIAIEAKMA